MYKTCALLEGSDTTFTPLYLVQKLKRQIVNPTRNTLRWNREFEGWHPLWRTIPVVRWQGTTFTFECFKKQRTWKKMANMMVYRKEIKWRRVRMMERITADPLPMEISAIQNIGSCETIWKLVFDNPVGNIKNLMLSKNQKCFQCFLAGWWHR